MCSSDLTLYDKIPDLPRPSQLTTTPSGSHVADGVIGSINTSKSKKKSSKTTSPIINLPDLLRLTNDPIFYLPYWPPMPNKFPSDIPKFEGKSGEDPSNHVMTYHLWCASNLLVDDSIRLHLFHRTLIGLATKWYIELP